MPTSSWKTKIIHLPVGGWRSAVGGGASRRVIISCAPKSSVAPRMRKGTRRPTTEVGARPSSQRPRAPPTRGGAGGGRGDRGRGGGGGRAREQPAPGRAAEERGDDEQEQPAAGGGELAPE